MAGLCGLTPTNASGPSGQKYAMFTSPGGASIAHLALSKMGPDEALHQMISAQTETQATLLLLVGTAFGVDRKKQSLGDVLLCHRVLPYDERNILHQAFMPRYVWHQTAPLPWLYQFRSRAIETTLLPSFIQAAASLLPGAPAFRIHEGTLLSGGARIESVQYRDFLLSCAREKEQGIIVGGDMETAAIASLVLRRPGLSWLTIKGICDFADNVRHDLPAAQKKAATNASWLAWSALLLLPLETF